MASRAGITIIKANGERVPFDIQKLEAAVRRSGATARLAKATARRVAGRVREGMTTQAIAAIAQQFLHREQPRAAIRYSLKEAMRRLGPTGYDFEKFIAEVLRAYGYAAELPDLLPGMCVQHEVDVVARKDGRTAMVECKYRNEPGIYVRLKDVMATWARFEDLREARVAGKCPITFDEGWIVCNTKVTSDGVAFGGCKGMRLIGWRHPEDRGLERMIEERHLYPITVLTSVRPPDFVRFAAAGIMLCHDLTAIDVDQLVRHTGLPRQRIERMRGEVSGVLRC
ncbi:hypothetical protein HY480_03355 [Candidatus Uhrbacteria bacterium]|nr:hypothetical protein [Candidatus Uhrbacteria bacterium]